MSRHLRLILSTALTIIEVLPAVAQNNQSAPEIDPDAGTYVKKYLPPGAPKSVEVGNYYLRKKKYQGALSRFQEAIQVNPTYAPAYLGLGRAYDKIGLSQKALDAYKKYLDALPSEKDALDAKEVQRAVARLEMEEKSSSRARHRHTSRGPAVRNSQ